MSTITQTLIATLITLGLIFASLSPSSACGPYDPVGFQQMQVQWLEDEVEQAADSLKEATQTNNAAATQEAAVRLLKSRADLKEARDRLEQFIQDQDRVAAR